MTSYADAGAVKSDCACEAHAAIVVFPFPTSEPCAEMSLCCPLVENFSNPMVHASYGVNNSNIPRAYNYTPLEKRACNHQNF